MMVAMVVLIVMMVMAAAVWAPLTAVLGMMVWSQQKTGSSY